MQGLRLLVHHRTKNQQRGSISTFYRFRDMIFCEDNQKSKRLALTTHFQLSIELAIQPQTKKRGNMNQSAEGVRTSLRHCCVGRAHRPSPIFLALTTILWRFDRSRPTQLSFFCYEAPVCSTLGDHRKPSERPTYGSRREEDVGFRRTGTGGAPMRSRATRPRYLHPDYSFCFKKDRTERLTPDMLSRV